MKFDIKKTALYLVLSFLFGLLFSGCSTVEDAVPVSDKPSVTQSQETKTQEPEVTATRELAGTWTFDDGNVKFTADIKSDSIQMLMKAGDSEGLYWAGTFPSSADDGEDIVSKADVAALARSLFGSQDKTKTFKYEDGKLNFTFTMMGVSKTVALSK